MPSSFSVPGRKSNYNTEQIFSFPNDEHMKAKCISAVHRDNTPNFHSSKGRCEFCTIFEMDDIAVGNECGLNPEDRKIGEKENDDTSEQSKRKLLSDKKDFHKNKVIFKSLSEIKRNLQAGDSVL